VSRVAVDDLVCPIFGQTWISGPMREEHWSGLLGGPRDGVMQEFMVLAQEGLVKAPRDWSPVQAATLPCAAVVAWNGNRRGVTVCAIICQDARGRGPRNLLQ
jgi:NADPH:quinone reductase-like Zn-dependent oxidoreductase